MNQPDFAEKPVGFRPRGRHPESGVSILAVVAILGVVFALVQGTVMYRTKSSARFQAVEMNKILAQQAAEAGIEENIADLGTRSLLPVAGMSGHATYTGKPVGSGVFSTYLTTQGMGPDGDTLELHSIGSVASTSQDVRARLRVRLNRDTSMAVLEDIDTTVNTRVVAVQETTTVVDTVVQDPSAMPPLNTTAAYQACMSSSASTCSVCHIPLGNPANRHVITIGKPAIRPHFNHHGDYITTDGTCDIYEPKLVTNTSISTSMVTRQDTTYTATSDTAFTITETARIKILSWR